MVDVNIRSHFKLDAFRRQYIHAAVNHILVQLEVGDAITQQPTGRFVFIHQCDAVSHQVQSVGGNQPGRSCTYHRHLFPVSFRSLYLDISFAESRLNDSRLILTNRHRLVARQFQYARLLAEGRADTSREFREVTSGRQYLIRLFPFAFVQGILPFGLFVSYRACPVAERHPAIHAAGSLQLPAVCIQCLFNLTEVSDSLAHRTVSRLLSRYI